MGEFAIGQPVPRFEDPRLVKGGGRYIADMTFPGMAYGFVLRSPHAHARIRTIDTAKAKAAPGVLAVLTGADYKAAGFGDLPVPGGLKRRDDAPRLPAALSGAGRGPRAHDRRLRRLRRRRNLFPGGRRRRTDRGRLRAAAGRRSRPAMRPIPACRWSGTIARTISASSRSTATRRRPTRRLRAPRMWSSTSSSSTASPRRPWSRAAPSASTSRPRAATPSTPRCSGPMCSRPSCRNSC